MTTARDQRLMESDDFKAMSMPIAMYCALSDCNTLIKPGTPVKKFDGATYVHVSCPTSPMKNVAIHKYGDAK